MGAFTIKTLSSWGFRDLNQDGKVAKNELTQYQNKAFEENQARVFQSLASLAGDAHAIEQSDLDILQSNPHALSQVMRADPEYQTDLLARAVLEQNHTEVRGLEWSKRDGIPPIAFTRLLTYSQFALNNYGLKVQVNGKYDARMAEVVTEFQNHFGLQLGRDGSFIDRSTFGALILSNQYNPAQLKESMEAIAFWLKKQSPKAFLLDNYAQSHPSEIRNFRVYADLIISALQYLYPNDVPPWKTEGRRDEANQCLSKHFNSAWISPATLSALAATLETHIPPR